MPMNASGVTFCESGVKLIERFGGHGAIQGTADAILARKYVMGGVGLEADPHHAGGLAVQLHERNVHRGIALGDGHAVGDRLAAADQFIIAGVDGAADDQRHGQGRGIV